MSSLVSMSVQNPIFQSAAKKAVFEAVQKEEGDNDLFNPNAPSKIDPAVLEVDEAELAEMRKYARYMKIAMLTIAGLLMFTAFYNIGSSSSSDVSTTFLAMYLFFFSILMCCFECALKQCAAKISENFGFLYTPAGKTIFLIFVAIISYQLSTVGKVVFALLLCYGLAHIFLICKHPKYPQYLRTLHYYSTVKAGKPSVGPESV
mmetsp:Transcript_14093/g.15271  ORF Transcript_14093/g.15271 Transcript_14093/m.15271 type:complete len:204 (-) Transcript_14093:12-623(-)|eukprot:gene7240-7814_t